jgi:cbb3-type cytochrome oxidase maturation protein
MSVVYLVLPLALLVVLAAVIAFVWSARSGQFDDLDTPAVRVLLDDDVGRVDRSTPLVTRAGAPDISRHDPII